MPQLTGLAVTQSVALAKALPSGPQLPHVWLAWDFERFIKDEMR